MNFTLTFSVMLLALVSPFTANAQLPDSAESIQEHPIQPPTGHPGLRERQVLHSSARTSESVEQDKDASSDLKTLINEIRALRGIVEQLEKRMTLIEREVFAFRATIEIDRGPHEIFRERRKRDLGLYVFPGLDAPPLTPGATKPD